jgi:predicted AAA+ superfamily ATPase
LVFSIISTVIEIGETLIIKPTHLLDQLQSLNNKPLNKVLLSMRRVCKSNLYVLFIEQLKKQKIADDHILLINFETFLLQGLKQ